MFSLLVSRSLEQTQRASKRVQGRHSKTKSNIEWIHLQVMRKIIHLGSYERIHSIQDLILKKKETSSVEYKTGTHDYFLRGKSSKPKEDSINTIDLERCVLFAYKDEEAMEVDESEMTLKTAPNIVERRAELTFKNPTDDK